MNDLVDSTAFLISTTAEDPWATAVSVLRAIAVSLRTSESPETMPSLAVTADWIESQIESFAFSALELKCTSSLATTSDKKIQTNSLTTLPK